LVLLFSFFCYAQKIEKKKIYLSFSEDELNCKYNFPLKTKIGIETLFNLCLGQILYYRGKNSDTLSITKLKNYKISSINEIEDYERKWKKKKFDEFKLKMEKKSNIIPKPFHLANKDYIFQTYIIELKSNNKFVLYPVEWRDIETQKKLKLCNNLIILIHQNFIMPYLGLD
jgi:hypothetical protein